MKPFSRTPAILALVASVLGLYFAGLSTGDYAAHLDRQLHDVHCTFIPGLGASGDAASSCKTALYSAYSAIFRQSFWGGIPISLFAMGLYAFFAAFSVALLAGGDRVSVRAYQFLGIASIPPVLVSVVMGTIAVTKLGSLCKVCVGLYVASIVLAAGGVLGLRMVSRPPSPSSVPGGAAAGRSPSMPLGHPALFAAWLALMGLSVVVPALVYVGALPDYRAKLGACGSLPAPKDPDKALVHLHTAHPKRSVTLVVDPMCPTCKALHERLLAEGIFDNLDVHLALFPLDNTCNWNVDRPMHPGACVLAKAVLCTETRAREALEWMYGNQEELSGVAKAGEAPLRARVRGRFGADVDGCIDARGTKARLNAALHYAVANRLPVSTPQMFLGEQRVCDEDTDLGLRYTLAQLAPEVMP